MGTKLNILEYTLIDCSTHLIYGPYETFVQARGRAEDFERANEALIGAPEDDHEPRSHEDTEL